jgi:hypothetical protein
MEELPWVCCGHLVKTFMNDLEVDLDDEEDQIHNAEKRLVQQINSFKTPYPLPTTISSYKLRTHNSLNEFNSVLGSLTELDHWDADQFIQTANYWLVDDVDLPGVALIPLIRTVYTDPQFIDRLTHDYNRPTLAAFLNRPANVRPSGNQLSSYWLLVSVQYGFMSFVQYLCDLHVATSSVPICWTVWAHAAKHGQLACLQYAHKNKYEWNYHVFTLAASHGHLECLRFLCTCSSNGATCPDDILTYALGHLPCLRYLHEDGLNSDGLNYFIWSHYICDVMKDLSFRVTADWFERQSFGDRVEILKYLFSKIGLPSTIFWNDDPALIAVQYNRLDCLIYLHETMGFQIHEYAMSTAAISNSLDCLIYMHKKGHRLPSVLYLYEYDIRIQKYILQNISV